MKTKLISIFALAIMMASCSNQELSDSYLQQPACQHSSNLRSYEEALQIAQVSIGMVDGNTKTRSASSRKISLDDSKVCLAGNKTRSEGNNDTLMYVFNFEDNQGFAIVAAPKNVEGLLAVTESGYYDPNIESDNENFNLYMKWATKYVENGMRHVPSGPILFEKEVIVVLDSCQTGPYVTVQWGQHHPEGEFCSNGLSGCTNTAVAQLMSYYEYPTSIAIDYPDAPISTLQLDWTDIKAHPTGYHSPSLCPDPDAHSTIAHLLRQIGKKTWSSYNGSPNSSDAKTESYLPAAKGFLRTLGYTVTERTYTTPSTLESATYYTNKLDNEYLFLIGADDGTDVDPIAHTWVIDGYKYDLSRHYYLERNELQEWIIVDIQDIERYMFHMNWGWYGDSNGYFLPKVLNTFDAEIYDGISTYFIPFNNTEDITMEEVCLMNNI